MNISRIVYVFILVFVVTVGVTRGDSPADMEVNCAPEKAPSQKNIGQIEPVACFFHAMPTGVTVSQSGRVFVNFPKWGDKVAHTVAEIKRGKEVAFPSAEFNTFEENKAGERLVSVQSVVVDPADRLWILDTGRIEWGPPKPNGPKLVCVDLRTDKVVNIILIPPDVALTDTYLNDVRFDLKKGKAGFAFITDSSGKNPGIIVVDLASGKSWRKLTKHESTMPVSDFISLVEGSPMMNRPADRQASPVQVGADGIAISNDGKRLYYCPLSSWALYSVDTEALTNQEMTDETVAKTVVYEGSKTASDGLESDADGNIYVTAYDHNAILVRKPDKSHHTIVSDPRVLWPDTLSVASDGYLYFIANQLHRQKQFHNGQDLREKPYMLFRVKTGAKPVLLK